MTFSYRGSRSGSLTAAFSLVLVIETVVLHLWLAGPYPVVAWCVTVGSLLTLGWVVADYQRLGRDTLRVDDGALDLRVGLRARGRIPLGAIVHATRPTWKELPAEGSVEEKGYGNLMRPAVPNVLLVLDAPHPVVMASVLRVSVRRIGLHLDDPDGFLAALNTSRTAAHDGAE